MNSAAWPGALMPSDPAPATLGSGGPFAAREARQLAVLRRRVLTAAGTAVNVAVTASATTLAVTFAQPEVDTSYGVTVTPNWNTTVWVTAKSVSGMTLNFGTAAPANATVDWHSFRSES